MVIHNGLINTYIAQYIHCTTSFQVDINANEEPSSSPGCAQLLRPLCQQAAERKVYDADPLNGPVAETILLGLNLCAVLDALLSHERRDEDAVSAAASPARPAEAARPPEAAGSPVPPPSPPLSPTAAAEAADAPHALAAARSPGQENRLLRLHALRDVFADARE